MRSIVCVCQSNWGWTSKSCSNSNAWNQVRGEHYQYILYGRARDSNYGPISTGCENVLCLDPRHPDEKCQDHDAVFCELAGSRTHLGRVHALQTNCDIRACNLSQKMIFWKHRRLETHSLLNNYRRRPRARSLRNATRSLNSWCRPSTRLTSNPRSLASTTIQLGLATQLSCPSSRTADLHVSHGAFVWVATRSHQSGSQLRLAAQSASLSTRVCRKSPQPLATPGTTSRRPLPVHTLVPLTNWLESLARQSKALPCLSTVWPRDTLGVD
jgi:hypothetical protein